jgi:hypothetical protein
MLGATIRISRIPIAKAFLDDENTLYGRPGIDVVIRFAGVSVSWWASHLEERYRMIVSVHNQRALRVRALPPSRVAPPVLHDGHDERSGSGHDITVPRSRHPPTPNQHGADRSIERHKAREASGDPHISHYTRNPSR